MKYPILFSIFITPFALFAQSNAVESKVLDDKKKAIAYANVLLLKAADSSFIKGTISEKNGSFSFNDIAQGSYIIKASFIGYTDVYSDIFEVQNTVEHPPLILAENPEFLDAVTLTAKRPVIQRKIDRYIYNVENTVVSSGTTFDILKRTPGVIVNQGQLLVKNRPAQVYINDRKVYLTSDELQQLLEGFAGVNVKSVEVITTPPAKYDAEGGVILNIVTSKNLSIGYKGSINASNTVGIKPKYNVGTGQYYKTDWLNAYASYNFNSRFDVKTDEGFVQFYNANGGEKATWEDLFRRDTRTISHSLNTILDFTLSETELLSFSANVLHTPKANSDITGRTETYNPQGQLDSLYTTQSRLENQNDNLLFNLSYEKQLGENGASLSANANYIDYTNDQTQTVATRYLSPQGNLLNANAFNTIPTQNSKIYTGQLDYTGNLGSWAFEAGGKFSGINSESRQEFFNTAGNVSDADAILNDNFDYTEAIYASYFSFAKHWKKWSFKAGLRGEYTDANGNSRTLGVVNTQEYFELFPTIYLINTLSDNHSFGVEYSRRIDRPRFQSLNPYRYFLNENNFKEGDPNIQPAIANKIKFNYTFKNKLSFDLYWDRIDNAMKALPFQDNENLTLRSVNTNLNYEQQFSFDVIYSEFVNNWMWMSVYASGFRIENEFNTLNNSNENIVKSVTGVFLNTQNYIIFKPDLRVTVANDFLSNFLSGSYEYGRPQYRLNIDIQKTFMDGRLILNLASEDLFNTYNIPLTSRYLNQNNSFFAMPESQKIRVGLSYKFGNFKLNDNSRETSVEEETRLQTN
ncbi:outer membrane receptor protein involved in Fe transport [Leeuwenhoekiella aestuarii]|uniref:Outer membrane receptor protein involved in Fe transport n=1 Tax=Leeuwenhoekiella aestuarii TaxID=2249426 RepID=A0A4Q0NYF8_9FLAO|nr:outer membrane beta-barrel family protein [Leeuwenhoekiella aestuarii]RXG17963.1 outer membrane receptor protein involved in Fe transport [Leeuwenhoekiella aestuarii]RXG19292.1 outer membrane receptor protein involved in Fe transport [Leeuwenhoekiella aestuarii]